MKIKAIVIPWNKWQEMSLLRTIAMACLALLLTITSGCGVGGNFAPGGGAGGSGIGGGNGTPSSRFVFVSNAMSNSISGFAIDKTSGSLTPVPGSPFSTPSSPAGLAVDSSSNFLIAANVAAEISVFKIDRTTGALKPVLGSPFAGKNQPQAVAISKNLVFIGNRGSNDISAYILDPTNGALSPVGGPPFPTILSDVQAMALHGTNVPELLVAGSSLADFLVHSDGSLKPIDSCCAGGTSVVANAGIIYVTNSAGIDVFTERVVPPAPDCENDPLSCKVGTFPAGSQPSSIAISGQFAFVANFGSNNVTTLTITGTDFGLAVSLAQLNVAGAGIGPSSVAVDSSGKFLYVTNQFSNDVSAFVVDQSTGQVTPMSGLPFATDHGPTFLVIVQ